MLLKQIRHFQAVIQQNSFTEAAALCNISQSGISLSIKALEEELGVQLMVRKNRSFELTEAGGHFYKKSLVLTADLEQLCRETVRIGHKEVERLSLGVLATYCGDELYRAMATFSEEFPAVETTVSSGSHEDLYDALRLEKIDCALSDQRRAFSDEYANLLLAKMPCTVEIASGNPLAGLDCLPLEDLKNTPCILVASLDRQEEEARFYREIVGIKSEILFADNLQAARMMGISNRGMVPVEGVRKTDSQNAALVPKPLVRNGAPLERTYCVFWKKSKTSHHIQAFADILKSMY